MKNVKVVQYGQNLHELDENTTVANNAQVQIEGSREVTRIIDLYNLAVIILVGYRVKSKRGAPFN